MQRLTLTLLFLYCFIVFTSAQEDDPPFSELIGLSMPHAEAELNLTGYRLSEINLTTDDESLGDMNTIVAYSEPDAEKIVQVTVLRDYNVRLVWDHSDAFQNVAGVRSLDGNELFTFVNLSDADLTLRNLQIATFDTIMWDTTLRANQCAQIWATGETQPFQLPECEAIQGANVVNLREASDQFWINETEFMVFQNGIHRGTCEVASGMCELWISSEPIAHDLAPYVYLFYTNDDLMIYNNSASQWMDMGHLSLNDIGDLSAPRIYDTFVHGDLDRLAPNQCVRITTTPNRPLIIDCQLMATAQVESAFWTSSFDIEDSIRGNNTLTCPATSDEPMLCVIAR